MGHDVLIDGILVERPEIAPHYQQLMDILQDNPLSIIEVACPLEICRARNIARGDRYENQSAEQAKLMAKDIRYAMTVHTDQKTPEECAEDIVQRLMK
jgi:adenylylsulfate kinase/chloramphenicol 3-O phosphotransferase